MSHILAQNAEITVIHIYTVSVILVFRGVMHLFCERAEMVFVAYFVF